MPKKTAKYLQACTTATQQAGITALQIMGMANQDELYERLQKQGYHWNSKAGEWEYHKPESANDPTPLLYIRVWADADAVEQAADEVSQKLAGGYALVERSRPYPCRPPKQLESRVYLKFLPKQKAR